MKHYTKVSTSSNNQDWCTPPAFFEKLNAHFKFTLDPCATVENALCNKFYTKDQDGLRQDWSNEIVFCNPPYNELPAWLLNISDEKDFKHCVVLCPARIGQKYFQKALLGSNSLQILFLNERIKFVGAPHAATFPSCLILFEGKCNDPFESPTFKDIGLSGLLLNTQDLKPL